MVSVPVHTDEDLGPHAAPQRFGTEDTFEAWQARAASDLTDCALCLESLTPGSVVRVLPCGHAFHPACAERWAAIRSTCPLCRCIVPGPDQVPGMVSE